MSSNRPEKIADLLKREVSKILNQEVKDPRLQNINITAVKVTDDIGIAYIFYTIIGKSIKKDESKIDNTILSKLSGMIRSKLSKIMEIRRVPKIIFKFDEKSFYFFYLISSMEPFNSSIYIFAIFTEDNHVNGTRITNRTWSTFIPTNRSYTGKKV